jgi:pilus assembly protein CpaB
MNRRILIIISCAFVLSICVSYLVYRTINVRAAAGPAPRTTQVVVAARDLEVGSLIRDIDLKTAAWMGPVPKGAIAKPDQLRNRGVLSPIYEGEPVTENRLAPQGSGGGLAGTIPAGMRACAVKVNEVVGVAGFVVPGMRVDVLVTGQPPGGNPLDGPRVRTLLQNIQVLSAGTDFQRDQAGKPEQAQVVTLLVTPSDAEVLSLASNETRIQLVLRNPVDTQMQKPPGTMVSNLFGKAPAPDLVAPAASDRRPSQSASTGQTVIATSTPVTSSSATTSPATTSPATTSATAALNTYVVEELNGSARTVARFSLPQEQR